MKKNLVTMKLVILAAGQGTRMLPLTENKPKAMIELKGKPILQWILERASEAGIKQAGIVIGFRRETITSFFGKKFMGIEIEYLEQKQHLGTASAIQLAKKFAGKEFIAVYGDVIPGKGLLEKLSMEKGADVVIVARQTSEPWKYGCLELEGSKVKGIIEKPAKGKMEKAWANAGIYKFTGRIFEAIEKTSKSKRGEYEITDSIMLLAGHGKVECIKWEKEITDIGNIQELGEAGKRKSV